MNEASEKWIVSWKSESNNVQASKGGDSNIKAFEAIIGKLPIGRNDETMSQGQQMHEQSKVYHFNPDNIAPPEVQRQLIDLLRWRDQIMRNITEAIEKIPGLSDLVEEFTNTLNTCMWYPYSYRVITHWSSHGSRLHCFSTLPHCELSFPSLDGIQTYSIV